MAPDEIILGSLTTLLAVTLLIAWRWDYFQPVTRIPGAPFSLIDVIFAFLFTYVASGFFAELLVGFGYVDQSYINFFVSFFAFICLALFTLLKGASVLRYIWHPAPDSIYSTKYSMLIGAISVFIAMPVVEFIGALYASASSYFFESGEWSQTAVNVMRDGMDSPLQFLSLVISVIIFAPIIEEWLFRGFIQGYLRGLIGPYWAIAITSLFFSMAHYTVQQGIGNIDLMVRLFPLACFIGYVYERQGNLWGNVMMHIVFNFFNVLRLVVE
jgi:membrane protease YdiL (CAAX protease family)